MAICKYCGKEMLTHCSCLPKLIINDEKVDRIRYGRERLYSSKARTAPGRCKDCGCKLGEFHHFNCDQEEHPITHKQLLMSILEGKEIQPTK